MTTQELIKELQGFPKNTLVVHIYGEGGFDEVEKIYGDYIALDYNKQAWMGSHVSESDLDDNEKGKYRIVPCVII